MFGHSNFPHRKNPLLFPLLNEQNFVLVRILIFGNLLCPNCDIHENLVYKTATIVFIQHSLLNHCFQHECFSLHSVKHYYEIACLTLNYLWQTVNSYIIGCYVLINLFIKYYNKSYSEIFALAYRSFFYRMFHVDTYFSVNIYHFIHSI